jgi:hypothetical protein
LFKLDTAILTFASLGNFPNVHCHLAETNGWHPPYQVISSNISTRLISTMRLYRECPYSPRSYNDGSCLTASIL